MNYNPEQHPKYVNQRIQEYIDTVMHPQCKTHQDKWTVASMVSWERFGSTICSKCNENRERLHMMVNGFKSDYDVQAKGTLLIDRKTTPYSEVPYQIRGTCEIAIMDFEFAIYRKYGMALFLRSPTASWTPDLLYTVGQSMFSQNSLSSSDLSTYRQELISLNARIDNAVAQWNTCVLQNKNIELEAKIADLKTQIQLHETNTNIKKCPYV